MLTLLTLSAVEFLPQNEPVALTRVRKELAACGGED
jgi:hypothetical protein